MPKQTSPRMVTMSCRVPADVKERGYAKAERLGVNPTAVLRELWEAWTQEEER